MYEGNFAELEAINSTKNFSNLCLWANAAVNSGKINNLMIRGNGTQPRLLFNSLASVNKRDTFEISFTMESKIVNIAILVGKEFSISTKSFRF